MIFFPTPEDWRQWLQAHHSTEKELTVGFYKKGSGKPSITWPESVDAALCFGWIDGVRRSINKDSYSIRFTPRKRQSNWSVVNISRVAELTKLGFMSQAGLEAFESRAAERSGVYAFEQKDVAFNTAQEKQFRKNEAAWLFFQAKPAWYRRTATWWVVSAKRDETRARRLAQLIEDSEQGKNYSAAHPLTPAGAFPLIPARHQPAKTQHVLQRFKPERRTQA